MDIAFVNPPNAPFSAPGILIEPIDLLGLATYAQSLGHRVRMLDMDVRRLDADDLGEAFGGSWPEVAFIVCDYHIPLHADHAMGQVSRIVAECAARGCRTVVGGKAATYADPATLAGIGADAFVGFDMEPAMPLLLGGGWSPETLSSIPNLAWNGPGGYVRNAGRRPRVDLDALPVPDRSLASLDDYIDVRTLLSSRGCHMRCDFCHVPGFWGGWQGRSAASVVSEIETLVEHHGARKILFLDDNAIVDNRRMAALSSALAERRLRVALGCLASVSRAGGEVLEGMAAGGFRWVHFGAETGDDGLLAAMGKRTTSAATRTAVAAARSAGLRVRTSWILDTPGIDGDGLKRTEEAILSSGAEEIRLHFLALRQGSILRERHPDVAATQFIHHGGSSIPLAAASPDQVEASVGRILSGLEGQGYAVVRDPSEFADMDALRLRTPGLKVVSLCPMRYGMGWES